MRRARQHKVLHVRTQRVADRTADRVRTRVQPFAHHVAHVVDHVGVVARSARHAVDAFTSVQQVVAVPAHQYVVAAQSVQLVVQSVARQRVAQCVARANQRATFQRQVLHVRRQRVVHRRAHQINARALARRLGHHVACVIHNVGVVAQTTRHHVRARTSVYHVRRAVARQDVRFRVAHQVEQPSAQNLQVLDVVTKRHRRGSTPCIRIANPDRIVALVRELDDDFVGAVNHVDVVAFTADQRVETAATDQRVVAAQAGQYIGLCISCERVAEFVARAIDDCSADEGKVLDVVVQRVTDRGEHEVRTLVRRLDHDIGGVVDVIDVVAFATVHRVGTSQSVDHVIAAEPAQRVISAGTTDDVRPRQQRRKEVATRRCGKTERLIAFNIENDTAGNSRHAEQRLRCRAASRAIGIVLDQYRCKRSTDEPIVALNEGAVVGQAGRGIRKYVVPQRIGERRIARSTGRDRNAADVSDGLVTVADDHTRNRTRNVSGRGRTYRTTHRQIEVAALIGDAVERGRIAGQTATVDRHRAVVRVIGLEDGTRARRRHQITVVQRLVQGVEQAFEAVAQRRHLGHRTTREVAQCVGEEGKTVVLCGESGHLTSLFSIVIQTGSSAV